MANTKTSSESEVEQTSGQFSTFYVADLFFGVDVLDVQEVLRAQQMTAVPQAPDVIEGLINLRGQIVTAIDMRRRLHMPPQDEDRPSMNMVIRTSDGAVSLLVDEIGDVLDMDASAYERPPQNLDPAAREIIRGVYKLKDGLLLILDTEKTIEVDGNSAPRNSQIDSQWTHEAKGTDRASSSVPETNAVDQPVPAQKQKATKTGARKTSAKKSSGAARGVQAESG
jgi:purine-binding chemotaxis protein CheW